MQTWIHTRMIGSDGAEMTITSLTEILATEGRDDE